LFALSLFCLLFKLQTKPVKLCLRCISYHKELRILKEKEKALRQENEALKEENAALKQENEALYNKYYAPLKKKLQENGQN